MEVLEGKEVGLSEDAGLPRESTLVLFELSVVERLLFGRFPDESGPCCVLNSFK